MQKTPKELGYSMPAEWEKHSVIWLAWPYDNTTFPDSIPEVEKSYCEIIKALEGSEQVSLIVRSEEKNRIEKILQDSGCDMENIIFFEEDYADVWRLRSDNNIKQRKWQESFCEVELYCVWERS